VAYHARALDDKVAEIYRFYIVPASNIRRSGMSRADSTNVCYDPHPVAPRDHLALRVAPGSRATNARRHSWKSALDTLCVARNRG
jgi:hypothetical protein